MTGLMKVQGDNLMSDNGKIVEITDQNFAETIEAGSGLTMVDFWAAWCGPCRMVAPIVEELAEEYGDDGLKVGKLDVDANPQVTVRFAVRSIPSILFFKDGEHVDTVVGAVPRPTLEAKVQEHM
jgi:thioredoxin 1